MFNPLFQTLLQNIQTYLETSNSIQEVPCWIPDKKFLLKPLALGVYHLNFQVIQGDLTWVLRISTGSQYGLSMQEQIAYEFDTLSALAPIDVAPKPYFVDHSLHILPYGVLGMEYLPGEHLDYQRDLQAAAHLFARFHQLEIPEHQNHLICEEKPLTQSFERSRSKLDAYFQSDLADQNTRSYLKEVLAWAEQACQQDIFFEQDPWHTLINTEVNSGNWIVNRKAGTIHLVDWEKPLWGDPSRDLSHFRVPTTTLWKTDYQMTPSSKKLFMAIYCQSLKSPHLRDTIEERTRLHDPFNCLRAVAWCAMVWVQHRQNHDLIQNKEFEKRISAYLDNQFVRSLFDSYINPI